MADREVTAVRRDPAGRTTGLANPDSSWWLVGATEAAGQIDAGLHRYYTRQGASRAWIHVVHAEGRGPYLRTARDQTTRDNLDDLPVDRSVDPAVGDFDVVLQFSETTVSNALRAMHASGALGHRAGIVTRTHVAVLVFGAQRVRFTGADPSTAIVEAEYQCWLRPREHLDDPGDCATGVITAPVRCDSAVEADDAASLVTDWTGLAEGDVSVSGSPPDVADLVRETVAEWARTGGGRYRVPTTAFGQPREIDLRFGASAGGGGYVQIGMGLTTLRDPLFPAPDEDAEVRLALSGRWVVRRVLESLEAELGALPPPHGLGDVDIGGGALTALDVELADSGLVIYGRMRAGPTAARFTVAIALSGGTPGTIRATVSDVEVEVDDLLSQIADFFSAGAVRRALVAGVRGAVEGGGGLADLLGRTTVRFAAALGSAAAVRLDVRLTGLNVRRGGVVLSGTLTTGATPAVQAAVTVADLPGRWRLVSAFDSWAPGDNIAAVDYDFGDGQTTSLTGPDVALAVPHEYAPGRWRASVTVTDARGRTRTASSHVARVGA